MRLPNNDRVVCAWCPDTEAYWNRFLDAWRCPDCGGEEVHSEESEEESV